MSCTTTLFRTASRRRRARCCAASPSELAVGFRPFRGRGANVSCVTPTRARPLGMLLFNPDGVSGFRPRVVVHAVRRRGAARLAGRGGAEGRRRTLFLRRFARRRRRQQHQRRPRPCPAPCRQPPLSTRLSRRTSTRVRRLRRLAAVAAQRPQPTARPRRRPMRARGRRPATQRTWPQQRASGGVVAENGWGGQGKDARHKGVPTQSKAKRCSVSSRRLVLHNCRCPAGVRGLTAGGRGGRPCGGTRPSASASLRGTNPKKQASGERGQSPTSPLPTPPRGARHPRCGRS